MERGNAAVRMDHHLGKLLEVEQRLEARQKVAEQAAAARLEAVRAEQQQHQQETAAALEAAAQAEERADRAAHQAELQRIREAGQLAVQRFLNVSDEEVTRLAWLALGRVIGGGPP